MSDILTGATKVSDINQQQLRLAMEEMTAMLDPNQHLLNKVLEKIGPVKSYGRRKVEWRERRLLPCSTTHHPQVHLVNWLKGRVEADAMQPNCWNAAIS